MHPAGSVAYLPQYPADELHLPLRVALLRGAGRLGEQYRRLAELERALPSRDRCDTRTTSGRVRRGAGGI